MHPICQILNFDDQKDFQNRRTEYMHAPIHIVGAPKIDKNEDSLHMLCLMRQNTLKWTT